MWMIVWSRKLGDAMLINLLRVVRRNAVLLMGLEMWLDRLVFMVVLAN